LFTKIFHSILKVDEISQQHDRLLELLTKIQDVEWVLNMCMTCQTDDHKLLKRLFELGVQLTDQVLVTIKDSPLLNDADGGFSNVTKHEGRTEEGDEDDVIAKANDVDAGSGNVDTHADDLCAKGRTENVATITHEMSTLETVAFMARRRLLISIEWLKTINCTKREFEYKEFVRGLVTCLGAASGFDEINPGSSEGVSLGLLLLARQASSQGNISVLQVLFERYSNTLAPAWKELLELIPDSVSPNTYAALLPCIGSGK
jgi:hypothetical protein